MISNSLAGLATSAIGQLPALILFSVAVGPASKFLSSFVSFLVLLLGPHSIASVPQGPQVDYLRMNGLSPGCMVGSSGFVRPSASSGSSQAKPGPGSCRAYTCPQVEGSGSNLAATTRNVRPFSVAFGFELSFDAFVIPTEQVDVYTLQDSI